MERVQVAYRLHLQRALARSHPHPAIPAPPSRAVRSTRFLAASDVRQISRDPLPSVLGSERDTQVEPDVAIDPNDTQTVVAVFQESRYWSGGSAGPGYAWSHDGGTTWDSRTLPHLTKVSGGPLDRASDPAVAIGPDGAVYVATIAWNLGCGSTVAVQRSDDGGVTFGDPVFAQKDGCGAFNDKEWVAVDTYPDSPHFGRVYLSWDRDAAPVMRYSDDRGETWSSLTTLESGIGVDLIPVVQPNGDLTIVWLDETTRSKVVARTSHDGGVTFDPRVTVALFEGSEEPHMRTGALPSPTVDPVTGELYVVWQDGRFRSDGLNDIVLSSSSAGGATWTEPIRVNQDAIDDGLDHVTPEVAAWNGFVHVTYRTHQRRGTFFSPFADMRYIHSEDGGITFAGELVLGPVANLRYAARAGGAFLGDYMGLAASPGGVVAVWCRSAKPPRPHRYHQTTWAATIVP